MESKNIRYYRVNLLIADDFEDQELESSELSTAEIAEFLTEKLPFGLKIIKKEIRKINEEEMKEKK